MHDVVSTGLNGPNRASSAARVSRSSPAGPGREAGGTDAVSRSSDQVEVSQTQTAVLMAKLQAMPDIRVDLVQRAREEIANGTYDTPERFEAALDEMITESREMDF
ncbi:MAG: flagellar biosynthesis anti-sigma factor FlgM [Planctomycetota bacterium]